MVLPRPNDRTFSTCQVHFIPIKDVWHTLLIQSGHKYSTPPPTLCHVTACVFHIGLLVTLLVGDDSNLLWNFFQNVRSTSYLFEAFGILYVLIQSGHKYCVLFGCVCVRSISAQTFETGVFMFELRSWIVCVWLCAVWVCVRVPSQLKYSRQGSLCLS